MLNISFSAIHYAGISLHNVDAQFKLQPFVLCCRVYDLENQTSLNIRKFVNSVLTELGLSLNVSSSFVISDN